MPASVGSGCAPVDVQQAPIKAESSSSARQGQVHKADRSDRSSRSSKSPSRPTARQGQTSCSASPHVQPVFRLRGARRQTARRMKVPMKTKRSSNARQGPTRTAPCSTSLLFGFTSVVGPVTIAYVYTDDARSAPIPSSDQLPPPFNMVNQTSSSKLGHITIYDTVYANKRVHPSLRQVRACVRTSGPSCAALRHLAPRRCPFILAKSVTLP